MNTLRLLPVLLSLLLLAAHCLRLGAPFLMIVPIAVLLLLSWPRRWTARLAQLTLVLGAAEWARSGIVYVQERQDMGVTWFRLAIIMGSVAILTLASGLVFRTRGLRRRYDLD